MTVLTEIVFSDNHLIRHGQSWPGVPIILLDGLLAPQASAWILDLRIRGCSAHTLISYAKTLALWLKALAANGRAWNFVGAGEAEQFATMLLREGCAEGTVRLRMVHIQEFYRWAHARGHIDAQPFHIQRAGRERAKPISESPPVRLARKSRRSVRPQSTEDFDRVLAMSPRKATALALRDELIAEAARYMGLRRSEVAALRADQFEPLDPGAAAQSIEIVSAKSGGRLDSVLVPGPLVKKAQDFIAIHRAALIDRIKVLDPAYTAPPSLFLNERGKRRGQGVSPDYIGESWRRSARAAGSDARFHDNRSSFATNAARAARLCNADARVIVKELLRHKHESTGEIYVKFEAMQSDLLVRARIVNDGWVDGHEPGEKP